jgi:hypothetical protein
MKQQIIKSADESKIAKIKFDSEYQEWQVRLYHVVGGKEVFQKDATYFTTDKEDATGTAQAMIK